MLWSRPRRDARRQKVLDELLELEPEERPARLEAAVAAGDVRADEVDSALRLVHRLEALEVMTVPPSGRLPGGIVPIIEFPVAIVHADELDEEPDEESGPRPLDRPVVSVDIVEAASLRITADLAARKTRASARSSRQRRLRVAAHRATAGLPAAGAGVAVAGSSHEESWPSMEWLRP